MVWDIEVGICWTHGQWTTESFTCKGHEEDATKGGTR